MNIIIDFNTENVQEFGESVTDTVTRILIKIAEDIENGWIGDGYIRLMDEHINYGFVKVKE